MPEFRSRHTTAAWPWKLHGDVPDLVQAHEPGPADARFCQRCAVPMADHGRTKWGGQRVCPGDWVLAPSENGGVVTVMHPDAFEAEYEEV